jgi:hypothetical protein
VFKIVVFAVHTQDSKQHVATRCCDLQTSLQVHLKHKEYKTSISKTEMPNQGSPHVSIAASVPPKSADYLHDGPVREVAE